MTCPGIVIMREGLVGTRQETRIEIAAKGQIWLADSQVDYRRKTRALASCSDTAGGLLDRHCCLGRV